MGKQKVQIQVLVKCVTPSPDLTQTNSFAEWKH